MQILLKGKVIFILVLIVLLVICVLLLNKNDETSILTEGDISFVVHNDRIEEFKTTDGNSHKVWESETDIKHIDKAFLFDIDNDGTKELVTLVWTNEDYFAERTYLQPIRGNLLSQHIRIYNISPYINIKWGGSTMRDPMVQFDICGNTIQFICGYESSYENFPTELKKIALFWDGWSFQINDYPDYSKYKQIFIGGETMLGRQVGQSIEPIEDKTYIFGTFKDIIKKSDLAILPLENTFVKNPLDCGIQCFTLQGKAKNLKVLSDAGVDSVFLASNHQGDALQEGYITTTTELKNNNIQYTGISNDNKLNYTTNKLGTLSIGLISADDVKPEYWQDSSGNYGVNSFSKFENGIKVVDLEKVNEITSIKRNNGIKILIIHLSWGNEYEESPDDYQKQLARELIDVGADLIVGTHPHVTQNYEIYKGKYIFYSLGNFIFDQDNDDLTRTGDALTLYINENLDKFPGNYLADIKIYKYKSCGPNQSNINLANNFSKGNINLDIIKNNIDSACIYYAPIEIE